MPGDASRTARIFSWIVMGCRVLVGTVVMKTGFDLARGATRFYGSSHDNFATGLFVIVIGAYFVFSSVFRKIFSEE